jgi:hypothetical protein
MSRYQPTGQIRVVFAASLAAQATPTVAEMNAAVDLTPQMRRDGLKTPMSGNTVDAADAASRFNKTGVGTFGGDAWSYQGYRDSTADTAWNALVPPSTALPDGTAGFLVIRRVGGSSTAWAAGNKVEVAPVNVNSRPPDDIGDGMQTFTATFAVTGEPNMNATVA